MASYGSAAYGDGDGEKPSAQLGQPLLPPPNQPYYAFPAAAYAPPPPPPPPPTLVFVPVTSPGLRLDRFRVNPPPLPSVDLHLALRLRVRNPGLVLPLRYRAVSAAVSYRGHLLGSAAARPGSGELGARGTTYADAEVWVDAGRVVDDVIDLIGDLAAGSLPLEIVTEVVGAVRVFRFDIPVKFI
uniref:Late embryogenesis abundant protein LEA-2 subgroup domain-containing protein n=1 Tax=Oryza rufipogon TaxID=4529 RepID=A0A0E0Q5G2_ORYRU